VRPPAGFEALPSRLIGTLLYCGVGLMVKLASADLTATVAGVAVSLYSPFFQSIVRSTVQLPLSLNSWLTSRVIAL